MSKVPPHGGKLMPLLVKGEEIGERLREAESLKKVMVGSLQASDLLMLGMGAFSPLDGFMKRDDYTGVVRDMRLSDGTLWPIPIVLPVDDEVGRELKEGEKVALVYSEGRQIIATMVVEEKYRYDKIEEAREVFGTEDEKHPGVMKVYKQGDTYIGGRVEVLSELGYRERFKEYSAPVETREIFSERGWDTVVAFQTRNPIHRSHEYITKVALEVFDGLFIHPIVGRLKAGDVPAEVRMRCYEVLLENYYPTERVVLKVYPMEMRYGGPREAVLHAIIRQNFGCTHIIIGRDHAGVGDYYGPYDAQEIFDQIQEGDLYIRPLKVDWTFWCYRCGGMASRRSCPHSDEDHLLISGTKLREMLSRGERPPEEFSRPEVVDILVDYYSKQK